MVDPAARLLYNNGENDNTRKETSAGLLTGGNIHVRLGETPAWLYHRTDSEQIASLLLFGANTQQ